MTKLNIIYKNPAELAAYANNAKTHPKAQIAQIARSITAFGFNVPVLINEHDELIAGHGRVEAAMSLGLASVPTILIGHLNEAERRAYTLADNRIAENAGWDEELLKLELSELAIHTKDLDITLTGFEAGEIDLILGYDDTGDDADSDNETAFKPDRAAPPISRPGDVWLLGSHKVLCGDCADAANWDALMDGAKAQMVFTDPPYNVPIDGHVSGKGQHKHREFAQASGEMSPAQFTAFLQNTLSAMAGASVDGSLHYVCMDWRHMAELLAAGEEIYSELKNICVWNKTNSGMGSLYRSRHEFISVFKKGKVPHINNVQLGRFGRSRSNVWTYAGVNTFSKTRDADLADHPTVKPILLVQDAILDVTHLGGIVIDGFLGSGTTLLAAHNTQRICYGTEIDPAYVDVILRRFESATGIEPVLALTGESLSAVRTARESQDVEAQP